ncbi:hypothetical protein [Streptobacillus notomytis]|uniref:hypothetical protein n=1 Tax=Streptobacillus notomytis TaxID=1712031 RepID=UPI00082C451F|nr:hypothetical protein [Streptobacillus notomytis]
MFNFIIIFFLTSVIFNITKRIIQNYNDKFEKVVGINNELIITKIDFFTLKDIYVDLFKVNDILINSLSFNTTIEGSKIKKFKIIINVENKMIFVNKKNNVLKIIKAIKLLDENLYYKVLDRTVFAFDPVRFTLEKEMEEINID